VWQAFVKKGELRPKRRNVGGGIELIKNARKGRYTEGGGRKFYCGDGASASFFRRDGPDSKKDVLLLFDWVKLGGKGRKT